MIPNTQTQYLFPQNIISDADLTYYTKQIAGINDEHLLTESTVLVQQQITIQVYVYLPNCQESELFPNINVDFSDEYGGCIPFNGLCNSLSSLGINLRTKTIYYFDYQVQEFLLLDPLYSNCNIPITGIQHTSATETQVVLFIEQKSISQSFIEDINNLKSEFTEQSQYKEFSIPQKKMNYNQIAELCAEPSLCKVFYDSDIMDTVYAISNDFSFLESDQDLCKREYHSVKVEELAQIRQKSIKKRATKTDRRERFVWEVLEIVYKWRKQIKNEKNLQHSSNQKVKTSQTDFYGIPKKSLDNYLTTLKSAEMLGFNFKNYLHAKFGVVRQFIAQKKSEQSE